MKNLVKIGFVILSSVLAYQTKADIPVRYPSLVKYESNGVCGLKNLREKLLLSLYMMRLSLISMKEDSQGRCIVSLYLIGC